MLRHPSDVERDRRTSWHGVVVANSVRGDSQLLVRLRSIIEHRQPALTHDGERPFVRSEELSRVADAVLIHPAAAVAVPMTDTVKIVREDLSVLTTPDRSSLYRVQTPQGFQTRVLLHAYEKAEKEGIAGTDDCSIVEKQGVRVQLLPGSETNIKITTRADLRFGEGIAGEEEA